MISNKIQQTQTLKLNISNNLVQSLKILNMGRQELEEELENFSLSNPVLDVEIKKDTIDWEKYFKNERGSISYDRNESAYQDDSDYDFENMTTDYDSLYDSLHGQINIIKMDESKRKICHYLVDSLDDDGYLREKEEDLANKFGVDKSIVLSAIKMIHSLEPAGIGARNLQECIILQLRDRYVFDKKLEQMVLNDLNLIANSNISYLSSRYKFTRDEVMEYIHIIRSLDPRPAQKYARTNIVYAFPDVIVEYQDGEPMIKSFKERNISLSINKYYKDLLLTSDDEEVKKYIKEKLNSAKSMINDIGERGNTIVSISNAIIEFQYDYFKNNGRLKPMTQADIADKLDLHISTISRGVNDKYMLTNKGLFELKRFFTGAYESRDGEDISTDTVKDEIKMIIDGEDKRKPLSDSKIENMLKEKGFDIARRTVSKYREELGYLSSSKRKNI